MDHPINGTKNAGSGQLIIPQKQTGRKNDIFICWTSSKHKTCASGKYIAIVATTVETDNPEKEVEVGMKLLGPVLKKWVFDLLLHINIKFRFVSITDTYEPLSDGKQDGVFISKSYDASTHFESCADDVLSIYYRITGEHFDLNKEPRDPEKEAEEQEKKALEEKKKEEQK